MKKIILILMLLLLAKPLIAQDKLQELPEVENLDINTFVANSKLIEKQYENDPLLAFQMQIPNNYTVKPESSLKFIEEENRNYGEIFSAYGPAIDDMRPYISVQSIELERLISAKNWMITKALELGYTLRAIKGESNDNSFEAFYIRLDNFGRTEIVRARGFLHEDRLILVEYVLPIELWQNSRDKQIYSIKSFEFLDKYSISSPEPLRNFSYLDSFYFEYPESWVFKQQEQESVNKIDMSLQTADRNSFILADAQITVVSSKSLKDRVDQMIYPLKLPQIVKNRMQALKESGYELDPVLEEYKYDLKFQESFQTTEVYPLREKTSSIYVTENQNPISKEFWITVIKRPKSEGKNYVVTMIAPTRKNNLYQWAIVAKAYEEIIESMR